jgi:hypothetical protein
MVDTTVDAPLSTRTPPLTGPFWHERMISHAESVLSPLRLA